MDSKKVIAERILKIAARKRIRACSIGVIVLAVLAVLQVNNFKSTTPMCELLVDTNLCNSDLQKLQIALSQSGLREFQIKHNRLMVPTEKHSVYLQAIAQQDAVPEELRPTDDEIQYNVNPFMSRGQRVEIARNRKKQQVRDMVLRLPFVEQAWFEMDKSDSQSAFEEAEQSSVISIRTPQNTLLSAQNVDTVKRMIGGAVAGLDSDNIVVIDLRAGYAHQDALDPSTTQQVQFQRAAIEQQRYYENQIRELLKDYPGIKVVVHVNVGPTAQDNHVASIPVSLDAPTGQTPVAPLPTAGANSFASIEDLSSPELQPIPPATVEQVNHTSTLSTSTQFDKKISVSIDVPQRLLYDLFGAPPENSPFAFSSADYQTKVAQDTKVKFDQLRSEIIQKVRPILPDSTTRADDQVTVNLIRLPIPESSTWFAQTRDFAIQNWPSAAVLLIGLMLLSIVTRKPDDIESSGNRVDVGENGDVLSINSDSVDNSNPAGNPDVRLSQLIEQDPDAAAKVIEAWIRDAA